MPEKTLNLSLRPKTFSELFGQEKLVQQIRKHIEKRPPNSWMFSGESGVGKTSIAQIMSIAYQCPHQKLWGDPCEACWNNKSSFAIHEINASDSTGKEEIGEVAQLSRNKPMNPNGKRVIILNESHSLSKASQNLLLDVTEEPPVTTIWIICTTDSSKIIDTLKSRFIQYKLKELGISEVEAFLTKQSKQVGITRPLADLFEQCHVMQVGSPRKLLQALEKYAAGSSAVEAVTAIDSKFPAFDLCRLVVKGDLNGVVKLFSEAKPEEARMIRAVLAGYIRGVLVKEASPIRMERAATSLFELSTPPYEDALMIQWLFGLVFKICKRYREVK